MQGHFGDATFIIIEAYDNAGSLWGCNIHHYRSI